MAKRVAADGHGGVDVSELAATMRAIRTTRARVRTTSLSDFQETWTNYVSDETQGWSQGQTRRPDGSAFAWRVCGNVMYQRLTKRAAARTGKSWLGVRSARLEVLTSCCGIPVDTDVLIEVVTQTPRTVQRLDEDLVRLGYRFTARTWPRHTDAMPQSLAAYFTRHMPRRVEYEFDIVGRSSLRRICVRTYRDVDCNDPKRVTDVKHTYSELNLPVTITPPPDDNVYWVKAK